MKYIIIAIGILIILILLFVYCALKISSDISKNEEINKK